MRTSGPIGRRLWDNFKNYDERVSGYQLPLRLGCSQPPELGVKFLVKQFPKDATRQGAKWKQIWINGDYKPQIIVGTNNIGSALADLFAISSLGHEFAHIGQQVSAGTAQGEALTYIVQWFFDNELGIERAYRRPESIYIVKGFRSKHGRPFDPWSESDLRLFHFHSPGSSPYYIPVIPELPATLKPFLIREPGERRSWLSDYGIQWPTASTPSVP